MYNLRISGNIIRHKLSKPPFLSVSCQFNGFPGQESVIYKEGKSSSSQHHCWRVITGSQMMMMMRTRTERTGDRVAHHERTKEKISINRMEWKIAHTSIIVRHLNVQDQWQRESLTSQWGFLVVATVTCVVFLTYWSTLFTAIVLVTLYRRHYCPPPVDGSSS